MNVDWHQVAEEAKAWGGAVSTGLSGVVTGIGAVGALIMKLRHHRRSELETLVNELQEECKTKTDELREKGVDIQRLNALVSRLDRVTKHQRLEIVLHERIKKDAKAELVEAIKKVKSNATDCLFYISRAVTKLEEDVVVPTGDEDEPS